MPWKWNRKVREGNEKFQWCYVIRKITNYFEITKYHL